MASLSHGFLPMTSLRYLFWSIRQYPRIYVLSLEQAAVIFLILTNNSRAEDFAPLQIVTLQYPPYEYASDGYIDVIAVT